MSAYFYCTVCIGQMEGQNYSYTLFIHSSLCVLNFLPTCIPKFSTVARTTQKVEQTAVSILLIYCTLLCKYCQGTQESV